MKQAEDLEISPASLSNRLSFLQIHLPLLFFTWGGASERGNWWSFPSVRTVAQSLKSLHTVFYVVFLLFLFLWHSTSLRSLSWPGPHYVDYPLNWLNSTGHCLCMQGSQECTNRPVGFCNNTDYGIIQPFSFLPWDQQTQGQWWSCCGVTTTFQWRIMSVLSLVHRRFKCLFGFLSVPLPHPSSLFSFFCHFFFRDCFTMWFRKI